VVHVGVLSTRGASDVSARLLKRKLRRVLRKVVSMGQVGHTKYHGADVASRTSIPARATRTRLQAKEWRTAYLSLLPALALVAVFLWYPLATALYHSFTVWDGDSASWVGFSNYRSIFTSGQIWLLLRNNLVFLLSIPGILLIAMVLSVLLFEEVPGWKFFRSVYYLPTILSAVVVGYLMRTLFSAEGVVNEILRTAGLGGLAQTWLDAVPTSFMVLILAFYWQTLGQGVMIFLAGLSSISTELLEAARVDGAGWWQRLIKMVIPLLAPAIGYFLITNVVYVFIGLFALVYSITRGGPGYETTPLDYMIYLKAFNTGEFGYASALAILLLILVSAISWFQIRTLDTVTVD
jgi:multiple sugar transport system permease protein